MVLYEAYNKPSGAALVTQPIGNNTLALSVVDYTVSTKESQRFWRNLLKAMRIEATPEATKASQKSKEHNLLMDGPVD